jgi:hypothetical protein
LKFKNLTVEDQLESVSSYKTLMDFLDSSFPRDIGNYVSTTIEIIVGPPNTKQNLFRQSQIIQAFISFENEFRNILEGR